jgi:diguanylate cyclase (GGDEF)-like protein/PAS domain S-box-containing protein
MKLASEEVERLAALRQLLVLDTAPEAVFDNVARMAATLCDVPVALLSLVDEDRQWFKATFGLDGPSETSRSISFCSHAIEGDEVFEVVDARLDPRFVDNPLVTGDPNIRFYAGAPLKTREGHRVGTLCVIGPAPQQLAPEQRDKLRALAAIVSAALEMRRELIEKSVRARSAYELALRNSEAHYKAIVEDQTELISLATPDGVLTYVNPAYARHFGRTPPELVGSNLYDFIDARDRATVQARFDEVIASGRSVRSENRMLADDPSVHWISWTNGISSDGRGKVLIHSVGRDITEQKQAEEALRKSRSFLYRTGRVAGVGGWEVDLPTGRVTWSSETRRIHEVDDDYVPSVDNAIDFYEAEGREVLRQSIARSLETGDGWDHELPLVTAKGRRIWVRAVGEVEHEGGQPVRLIGAFQDISERMRLEEERATQAETLRLIAETVPAAIATVDRQGRYTFVNSSYAGTLGRPARELLGQPVQAALGAGTYEECRPHLERAMAGEAVTVESARPHEGSVQYAAVNYLPLRGAEAQQGVVIVSQDVTRQRLEALRLVELAQRDPLTGLLNRKGFERFLERQLLQGHGPSLGLLYVDLDDFKPVNDRYGHPAGDEVLKRFSQRLGAVVRESDAVARLGGDEFAVVLTHLQSATIAEQVAEKILATAIEPFDIGPCTVRVHASIGVAYGASAEGGIDDLIARADARLLRAKSGGKGRRVS